MSHALAYRSFRTEVSNLMPLTLHHHWILPWLSILGEHFNSRTYGVLSDPSFGLNRNSSWELLILKIKTLVLGTANFDVLIPFNVEMANIQENLLEELQQQPSSFSTLVVRIGLCLLPLRSRLNNSFLLLNHRIYFGECTYKSNMYTATALFSSRRHCSSFFFIISSAILLRLLCLTITCSVQLQSFSRNGACLTKTSYFAIVSCIMLVTKLEKLMPSSTLCSLWFVIFPFFTAYIFAPWTIWPSMFLPVYSFILNSLNKIYSP